MIKHIIDAHDARRLVIQKPFLSVDEVMEGIKKSCMNHETEITFTSGKHAFTDELINYLRDLGYIVEIFTSKITPYHTYLTIKW